ncbi:18342_t:CDS:1 [Rhizophagus irregularis]|nr:18342_t:CDS:1 [Rhizophagus irregularis]
MAQESYTDYQSNYDKIINDPIYEEIKLNKKLSEELKFSETLCNQLKDKYESLGKYCENLQNNFININNILGEKQELKKKIGDLNDHNSKLINLLVDTLEEKNNVIQKKDEKIQENDKEIQENNKIIQEKDDLTQGKDNLIQQKDNTIKVKDNIIQEQEKEIQNLQEYLKEQNKEIRKIQEENSLIQEIDSIIQEKDNVIQQKDYTIQQKDNKIQELVKKIQEKDKTIEEKDRKIQEKDKEIQESEQGNYKLKKEAFEYQYALEAATNFRLSDDDKNNSVKLKEDIINLRHSLENYITKCKGNVEINIPEVQNLLKQYGSQTDITKDQKKPLIRVAIQRHVIEQIIEYAMEYLKDSTGPRHKRGLESFMYRKANELIEAAEVFTKERDGTDDTTKVFPTKLRQQIFAALGNRGFNNVVINKNNQNFLHFFIKHYQSILNKEIDKYRNIKDPEKKQETEDMAGDIIRKVVTLFMFRFKVQEPIAECIWFDYKDKIDPSRMEGIWDDEDIDDIVVDICHFPLIANKSTGQIYTPAKVFHIHNEEINQKNGVI